MRQCSSLLRLRAKLVQLRVVNRVGVAGSQGCEWCFCSRFFLHSGADQSFVPLWHQDPVLELQFLAPLPVILSCFATQCLQIAVERLLAAAAARVILLSSAADNRELASIMMILAANLSCIHVSVNLACAWRCAWQVQRAVDQSRSNNPRILSGLARSALLAWWLGNFDHVLRFARLPPSIRKLAFGDRFDL